MENNKNSPPAFPVYVVGETVPQWHIVFQNMVVPVSIYNELQLKAKSQVAVKVELNVTIILNYHFCGKRGQQPLKLVYIA